MIAKPSFSPEYAVILGRVWDKNISKKVIRYELKWVRAKRQIWHMKQIKGTNSYQIDPLKNPGVDQKTIEFPAYAALEISKAWSRIIRQSRYPSEPIVGLDGAIYEFYSHFNLFGQTWSPESGAPALMVDLGEALIAYVRSKEGDRAESLSQCLELSRKLQEYSFQ